MKDLLPVVINLLVVSIVDDNTSVLAHLMEDKG